MLLLNYIYNLLYQALLLIIPLIIAPFLARTLGATGIGIYGYVNSTTVLIYSIITLGIYNYGNRQIAYVRDDKEKLSETFWRIITVRIIMLIIGTIVYFGTVFIEGRYKTYFFIYYTFFAAYFLDCTWLFTGVEDMKWAVLKNTFTKVLATVLIFLFIRNPDDTWKYILIQGGSTLIANLTAYTQIHRYVGKPQLIFTGIPKVIKGSVILFLPGIASSLYTQCDKIMIELMTNKSALVSQYEYAEKLVSVPMAFILVMSTVLMPRMANEYIRGNRSRISDILNSTSKISVMLAMPLMFGMIAITPKLIPWYLGEEFTLTINAIILISPTIITQTMLGISGSQYFTATNQVKVLLKAQIPAALGNLVINAILIPRIGMTGAAIATTISSITCAFIQYYYLLKQIRLPGLVKCYVKYFGMSAVMLLTIRIFTKNAKANPVTTITQIIIGVTVYFLICLLVKDEQFMFALNKVVQIFRRSINKKPN